MTSTVRVKHTAVVHAILYRIRALKIYFFSTDRTYTVSIITMGQQLAVLNSVCISKVMNSSYSHTQMKRQRKENYLPMTTEKVRGKAKK